MQEFEPLKKIKKKVHIQTSVDEELSQKLHEEEQARFHAEQEELLRLQQEQEKYDLEKSLELQKQLDEREEAIAKEAHDIDWSDPTLLRYHALQNRSFSVAEVRKNMCMYLKNQGGYKQSHFKGMSYEEIRPIFKRVWDQNQSFVPMDSKKGSEKKARGSRKKTLAKKRAVPEEGMHVKALQTKYLLIYLEIYTEDSRVDDLVKLWSIVQERFNSPRFTEDKEKELWVELKRLFEPIDDDELWKSQRYMHDPLIWRLYDTCGVHHVSLTKGNHIFMLIEKDYPLSSAILTLMLVAKLQVDQHSKMAHELLKKIFILANRPRQ
ncbi:hypothetical protein Tco_0528817 [Tanacetum coccineum]